VELVGYRAANYRTPMRVRPSEREGRFHTLDSPPTQYLCRHPLGPAAEIVRHSRSRIPADAAAAFTIRVWALRLTLPDDIPVYRFGTPTGELELLAELVGDDYEPTQRLADDHRSAGAFGAIVPSAALPGTENIVLFGERVAISYADDPIDEWEVPASMTVATGSPPASLLPLVRRFGQTHPALDAWRRGDEFRFAEPDWAATAGTSPV
jgi:hypothetical protein